MFRLVAKPPAMCSPNELATFAKLLLEGGEVVADGIEARIASARMLSMCYEEKEALGIAGIKNPLGSYRTKITEGSGQPLPIDLWPHELGWVYVVPPARKSGIGNALLSDLLPRVAGNLFATARTDNAGMHKLLLRYQFQPAGRPYASNRPGHQIQLFLRSGNEEFRRDM